MNAGIDYGLGTTNIDKSTGIRFGVIPQHAVGQAWYDSSEPYYGEPSCPNCGSKAVDFDEEKHQAYKQEEHAGNDHACESCELIFGSDEAYPDEALSYYYKEQGYEAECGDSGDIFVCKSPYYTHAQFCSPCAPGACYLLNPVEDGPKAYCFGHDWFENGHAPYPVYSVATGVLVEAVARK